MSRAIPYFLDCSPFPRKCLVVNCALPSPSPPSPVSSLSCVPALPPSSLPARACPPAPPLLLPPFSSTPTKGPAAASSGAMPQSLQRLWCREGQRQRAEGRDKGTTQHGGKEKDTIYMNCKYTTVNALFPSTIRTPHIAVHRTNQPHMARQGAASLYPFSSSLTAL